MRALLQQLTSAPAQILQIVQPTPFTVTYTISTRPKPRTITAHIASLLGFLVRIVAGLSAALLLWTTSRVYHEKTDYILAHISGCFKTEHLLALVDRSQWLYTVPCALVVLMLVFKRNYTGVYLDESHHAYLTRIQKSPLLSFVASASRLPPLPVHTFSRPRRVSYPLRAYKTFSYTKPSRGLRSGSTLLLSSKARRMW